MKPEYALRAIALIACLLGIVSIAGNLVIEDIVPLLRITSALAGVLLVVAAWLLATKRRSALLLLWLSAAIYFASIVYPGFQRHGSGVFGALMAAFYWSLGLRLVLAALAHLAFRFASAPPEKS